jgi:hypothetical protein
MDLFPDLPEDIAGLGDDEINALFAEYQATADRILNDEVEGLTSLADRVAAMERGAELIDLLRVDRARRVTEAEALQTQLEEAAARAILEGEAAEPEPETTAEPTEPTEPTADADPETPAEPEATTEPVAAEPVAEPVATITPEAPVAEPEPIAAAATPARRLPRRRQRMAEPQREQGVASIVAAAGVDGYGAGDSIPTMRRLAEALQSKHDRVMRSGMGEGSVDYPVATILANYPAERDLRGREKREDVMELVAAVTSPEALTASGGLCAPVEPYYGLANVSSAERPVRAALASFQANRGGVNVAAVPTLADVDDAVGIMTEADDATGGTTATKTCQVVDCPQFTPVNVDAVYHCVQFGNMTSRAWPEQVQQFTELVLAAHARTAETNLLDSIAAGSTQVTDVLSVAGVSGYTQVVGSFAKIAAGMRSRHRMSLGASIRVIAPAWLRELIISDLARSAFTARENAEALLNMELSALGINVTWTRDGESGKSQVFGAQAGGAITDFPATAYYYAFPEGSWLYLDAGTLELGIVRDSTLNSTNDYQIFGETFEQAAFIGVESIEVALQVCDTGAFASTVTIPCSD